jgi:hypothetical protein
MVYRINQSSSNFNIEIPVNINVFAAPNMAILLAPGETINLGHGILVRNDRAHAVTVCLKHTPNQQEGQWHVDVEHGHQLVSYRADDFLDKNPHTLFKVVVDADNQEEFDVEIEE